jgi:hypothetical protein
LPLVFIAQVQPCALTSSFGFLRSLTQLFAADQLSLFTNLTFLSLVKPPQVFIFLHLFPFLKCARLSFSEWSGVFALWIGKEINRLLSAWQRVPKFMPSTNLFVSQMKLFRQQVASGFSRVQLGNLSPWQRGFSRL